MNWDLLLLGFFLALSQSASRGTEIGQEVLIGYMALQHDHKSKGEQRGL